MWWAWAQFGGFQRIAMGGVGHVAERNRAGIARGGGGVVGGEIAEIGAAAGAGNEQQGRLARGEQGEARADAVIPAR